MSITCISWNLDRSSKLVNKRYCLISPYLYAINDPPAVLPGDVFADPDRDAGVHAAVVNAHEGAGGGLGQQQAGEEEEIHVEELLSRKPQLDTMAAAESGWVHLLRSHVDTHSLTVPQVSLLRGEMQFDTLVF